MIVDMPDDPGIAAMRAHYDRGLEFERLGERAGQLEFERTKEIVLRHLPPPPAVVADVGGGPGRYALWLAQLGYRVLHRDLMPLHVEQLRRAAAGSPGIRSAVGDARQLDLASETADAVLLLGPLYHLDRRTDRLRALAEAHRVVRPGGPVFAAAISRWAARIDGILRDRLSERIPEWETEIVATERTGRLPALRPGSFAATRTGPVSYGQNWLPAGSRSSTWSAWRARRTCSVTCPSVSPMTKPAASCWNPPARSSEFPNCSGSGRTCSRPRASAGSVESRMGRGQRLHAAAGGAAAGRLVDSWHFGSAVQQ